MFPEHTIDDEGFYKTAVSTILDTYSVLEYQPHGSAWTILASFFLSRKPNISLGTSGEIKVISLATGTKCLPILKLSDRGESVHDSHAEVLARRSALRWFMEEILRVSSSDGGSFQSAWITRSNSSDGKYTLQVGVELNLYVSTVPCGDASMRFLASSQDEEMATLKNSSAIPSDNNQSQANTASRGRDNYALLGVLRTKPGRADSPSISCMSCSDKIARWNVLGTQGALGSRLLEPLYLSAIVVGEVTPDMKETVREDCERAFWSRLGDINGLPDGYAIHKPVVHFSDLKFAHSRSVLGFPNSCVESFFWISDSGTHQVLIKGKKRGVGSKYRYKERSRSLICRLSLMELCNKVLNKIDASVLSNYSYNDMKRDSAGYQKAKDCLIGERGPFAGWILTGSELQNFTLDGESGNGVQEK